MTITNIFFDAPPAKQATTFLSYKIVPEGWATIEH